MTIDERFAPRAENLVASLREVVNAEGLHPEKLTAAIPSNDDPVTGKPVWTGEDRQNVFVAAEDKAVVWRVERLSELFRGDAQPPSEIDKYPPEYVPLFRFIESQAISYCHIFGDKTDQEFLEVYSNLGRRPDGRSLGAMHDFMWQVCALMLGSRVVSAAEFEAVLGALARSARGWTQRPISRNYISFLRRGLRL